MGIPWIYGETSLTIVSPTMFGGTIAVTMCIINIYIKIIYIFIKKKQHLCCCKMTGHPRVLVTRGFLDICHIYVQRNLV